MNYQIEELIIYSIIAFVVGAIAAYFIIKSIGVKRTEFEELKEKFGSTQNELDTQKALAKQFSEDKLSLESKLSIEQETNRAQEKELSSIKARYEATNNRMLEEKDINKKQQIEIREHKDAITELNKELAKQSANNEALNDKLEVQKEEIKKMRQETELHFEKVANRLLEEKSEKFTTANKENIKNILNPLQEKIKTFEERIEKSNKDNNEHNTSLKEMVKNYTDLSKKIGEDANNLAKALKGDFKQQGNWGEIILQTILDKSGLVKDREYFLQKSETDAEGKTQRPDVVIELPDNKRLIVDSKVSLVAYDAMVAAKEKEEAEKHLKNHTLAIKNHINGLAEKNYQDLYQVASPDFVMMFIPIDTAFSSALQYDASLYELAFSKNIIIVTASTLLATLKTVESLWKNDKQNRFAMEIADEAGKMYDKFVGFTEDMQKIGNQLNTVQKTYNSSMNKLSEGSGNLIRRAEKVKDLGANAHKSLAESLTKKHIDEPTSAQEEQNKGL